jgi:HSP20 family protein
MSTYIRWNPFREMAAMQSALDRLFDDSFRSTWPATADNVLAFDVLETNDNYVATVTLPGLTADDINIRFEDGTLTVSAEIPQPTVEEGARVLMQERGFGQFSRSIRLPDSIDADHVEATYEDGVLTLTLPKAEEAKPRLIPIKSGGLLQSKN